MRLVSDLSDKERILLNIIRELYSTMLMRIPYNADFTEKFGDATREYVHFDNANGELLKPGDLVLCQTSGLHDFTIAWVVESIGYAECLLREIGSQRTCRMSNEGFLVIRGLDGPVMWEGDRYVFYRKVLKAFAKGNEYMYRFGGLAFDGDNAAITIRECFGGAFGSVPFVVTMPWTPKTTIKAILAAMREGGYGIRKFEKRDKEPTP